ncbi:MAG: T9SS type A sorting domain-containing protein [Flavobacteriales bacterium]|nr:T9SS type A sorting domain-containing protein [Flavobacteriales bacterium]
MTVRSDSLALVLNVGSDTLVLVASTMFCPEVVDTAYFEMNEGPAAYFELGEFDTVCVNELINLSAINSLGEREWLIDGEVVSVFNSLDYAATDTGVFELTLRSTSDFCGVAEYSDTVTVTPNPTVSLTYDENTNQLIALPSGFTNYAWYYNGAIVNSTENVYDFEGNGGYRVRVTDEFGCKSFSDQVQLSVGIEEVANGMFMLSPNPNNGTFSIESETVGLVGYMLWDPSGRLLQSESIAAVNRIKVETNLPAGVYLLHVATEQGIIKQRVLITR